MAGAPAVDARGWALAPMLPCYKGGGRPCPMRLVLGVKFECIYEPPQCPFQGHPQPLNQEAVICWHKV